MARRRSLLEQMWASSHQATARREREGRQVEEHVHRSVERARARKAAAEAEAGPPGPEPEPVRAERAPARPARPQPETGPAADVRERNESLQYYLRRLTEVLLDRERVPAYVLDELGEIYLKGGADAFAAAVGQALSDSRYPPSVPARTAVLTYLPAVRELVVERELPRTAAVPAEVGYRLDVDGVTSVPRPPAEARHRYGQLLARVTLRTVAEAFALTPAALVDRVVLGGRVSAVDPSTGQHVHPELIHVTFDRPTFAGLHLDAPELDPEACLRRHDAQISPHPYELVPVEPAVPYPSPGAA